MPDHPATFENFQSELAALVNNFQRHHDEYMRANYAEADVRSKNIALYRFRKTNL